MSEEGGTVRIQWFGRTAMHWARRRKATCLSSNSLRRARSSRVGWIRDSRIGEWKVGSGEHGDLQKWAWLVGEEG